MKNGITKGVVAGIAFCTAAGAVAVAKSKKSKARRIAKRTGKQIEMVGTMIQSFASMSK